MQFKKLDGEQKKVAAWRRKRNRLVSELLAANPKMLSYEALAEANRRMKDRDKPKATAVPATIQGEKPTPARKRHVMRCRHCGGTRPAGELWCAGCGSPWVTLRSR